MLRNNCEKSPDNTKEKYLRMRIRHANIAFNCFLSATLLSGIVSLVGIVLIFSGEVTEGAITGTGGTITTAALAKLSKDANDRVDKAMQEYKEQKKNF